MSIAPIRRTVTVKAPPQRAFERFTQQMAKWWPPSHHVGGEPFHEIVLEPRAEGRWFERDQQGREAQWGKVIAWEPPLSGKHGRVLLAWQLDASFKFDTDFVTELELTFALDGTGTRVTLEHRNLERYGDRAAELREKLDGGWPGIVEAYAAFTDFEGAR
ncbi:MAG: hypothetical protein JWM77_3866 [Rhodospirillales bacterium]|jgi:uncharacterized protein YndB with AHSA1/START domain|nr:hypothetical protein [Rhodospirillales bacterium]